MYVLKVSEENSCDNGISYSTEIGSFARMSYDSSRDDADWPYFRLVDNFAFEFRPLDEKNDSLGQTLLIRVRYRRFI